MAHKVRQAAVIVHGMGEQKPNDTLRGFIGAALPPNPNADGGYYSRPDKMSRRGDARVR